MRMRAVAASLLLAAAVAGCASTGTGGDGLDSPVSSPPSEESQLYSAALHQLVLVDNPFARSPSPVGYVFVVDGSQFDTDLKNDITAQSGDLPSVEFIASPDQRADVGRQGLTGVENDGVIIELDPTQRQDDGRAHAGVRLWCGIDCGIGLTYVLERIDGQWTVTGTTGPVTIS